jgi:hypothetical protein
MWVRKSTAIREGSRQIRLSRRTELCGEVLLLKSEFAGVGVGYRRCSRAIRPELSRIGDCRLCAPAAERPTEPPPRLVSSLAAKTSRTNMRKNREGFFRTEVEERHRMTSWHELC